MDTPYPMSLDVPGSPHTYWGRFLGVPETSLSQPFYVCYFNPERKTLQKVEFRGFGKHLKFSKSCMYRLVYPFVDHVEDLNVAKFLKSSILAPLMTHLSSTSEEKQKTTQR
ncbi:hypothetical protein HID58_085796 [Brassica napus]|uniref:F-box associated beta-propeller type 3 domain-containing protein n=1 Tax=Brassica napus TaxID=3708 RepID=A0ABQ7XRF4_BRANA|nr:hypothetical protein HID58_085796 [Brassica napus]